MIAPTISNVDAINSLLNDQENLTIIEATIKDLKISNNQIKGIILENDDQSDEAYSKMLELASNLGEEAGKDFMDKWRAGTLTEDDIDSFNSGSALIVADPVM